MKIANREIGNSQPPYVVAEISGNHGGVLDAAKRLIRAAKRKKLITYLNQANFPIRAGYSKPLPVIFPRDAGFCPVAEQLEAEGIISYEICAYDPKARHLQKMREIVKRAVGVVS